MIEKRSIATAIILSIVTCGIYSIIWFIKLTDEVNTVSNHPGDTSGGMAFVFTILTCGIYELIWYYKMGEKLDEAAINQGRPSQSRGIIYLVLGLFGLGIVSYALIQDSLNNLA